MLITKASGDKVPFNKQQYINTLKRVGLSLSEARKISNDISQDLYPEIPTEKIYKKTWQVLKRKDKSFAAKFSLKRAIRELGPAGYYFERYMAAVLSAYGYKTKHSQILKGKCVSHEVDIVAERNGKKFMCECKFHTNPGRRSDIKVALYVQARFLDLKAIQKFNEAVLITNTRFTSEAMKYSRCSGIKIIGWHHPVYKESLEYYIESKKLYPVTVLTSLTNHLAKRFREENIVLAKELLDFNVKALAKKFRIKDNLARSLINEAEALN